MAWILFKETLLVPYFYMQKLLLGGNKFLDNVSVDIDVRVLVLVPLCSSFV